MKEPLDLVLVDKRFVESRIKAQWLVRNGHVLVDGQTIIEPGTRINSKSNITVLREYPYVGRGGIKLEKAIKEFSVEVKDKTCADIGASIGGFTDCLLKHGAKKVYSIDTATDLLHPSLLCEKNEGRVMPLLGIDARNLKSLEEKIDLCTIDVSFTSLRELLPNVKQFLKSSGDIIALVKPLFELKEPPDQQYNFIDDPKTLSRILNDLKAWAENMGLIPQGLIRSPLEGKGGSTEFFFHFRLEGKKEGIDMKKVLENLFETEAHFDG